MHMVCMPQGDIDILSKCTALCSVLATSGDNSTNSISQSNSIEFYSLIG